MSNFTLRFISFIILTPIAFLCIYLGGLAFNILISVVGILMIFEWVKLTILSPVALHQDQNPILWSVIGYLYIGIPITSIVIMRMLDQGFIYVLWFCTTIWVSDTTAYLVGKNIGKIKLAPNISPNKTWEGLLAAIIFTGLWGYMMHLIFPLLTISCVLWSCVLAILSQISDLLESKIKRHFRVKDSGTILPGNGGILDRVDGYILTAPFILLLIKLGVI